MLLYGQPGIRKTSYAFTGNNTLLVDADRGIQRLHPKFRGDYVSVDSWQDIEDLISDDRLKGYDNLAIDTAGRALDLLAAAIIKENPKLSYQGGLSQQGWGVLKNRFTLWLTQVEQLKMKGLTFIAHDMEKAKGDDTIMRPDIAGGSMKVLVRVMDLVGYMESQNNISTITFDISDRFWSKNSCNIPKITDITKTTIDDIHQLYYKQQAESNNIAADYSLLVEVEIPEIISHIIGIETAKKAAEELKELRVIWDSRAQAGDRFKKKLAEVKLIYNSKTASYDPIPDEPNATAIVADTPPAEEKKDDLKAIDPKKVVKKTEVAG